MSVNSSFLFCPSSLTAQDETARAALKLNQKIYLPYVLVIEQLASLLTMVFDDHPFTSFMWGLSMLSVPWLSAMPAKRLIWYNVNKNCAHALDVDKLDKVTIWFHDRNFLQQLWHRSTPIPMMIHLIPDIPSTLGPGQNWRYVRNEALSGMILQEKLLTEKKTVYTSDDDIAGDECSSFLRQQTSCLAVAKRERRRRWTET